MSIHIHVQDSMDDNAAERTPCFPPDFQIYSSAYHGFVHGFGTEAGIGVLHGMTCAQAEPLLWNAFLKLQESTRAENWDCSPGYFVMLLWSIARSHPQSYIRVSQ